MLLTLLYFLIALVLLITIHEYGHFIVARLCGVKVLRFSLGFGKVLARWSDKSGTEYALSLVPLGGYVKMLDENEAQVAPADKARAFNNQPIWIRILIVLAGPIFNFLFAFVALWLVLVIGMYSLAPIIAQVDANSIAAKAGLQAKDEIITLDNRPIASWHDFQYAFMPLIGSGAEVPMQVKSPEGTKKNHTLSLKYWQLDPQKPDLLASLGITPFIPAVPPVIGEVVPDSPAAKAGLKTGDKIRQYNNIILKDWLTLVDYVKRHPDATLTLEVERGGTIMTLQVSIGSQDVNGRKEGFLGMRSQKIEWPDRWLRYQHQQPFVALGSAAAQTVHITGSTFALIGRFISGKLSLQSLSGPVGIAQGAGESGRSGFVYYLSFLALISISLGVLNLLPIPMLDGGHLLFLLLEWIKGKPLAESTQSIGLYFGMLVLAALMFLAFANDISRLAG